MPLRIAIAALSLVFAIALFVDPALLPGARNTRIPVALGLVLLALVNLARIAKDYQVRSRAQRLERIPKKPLGL